MARPDGYGLAALVDQAEILQLAYNFVESRPTIFNAEAVFKAPLKTGGVFHEGLGVRVVWTPPGVLSVYANATNELLARSRPGQPLKPARAPRRGARKARAA